MGCALPICAAEVRTMMNVQKPVLERGTVSAPAKTRWPTVCHVIGKDVRTFRIHPHKIRPRIDGPLMYDVKKVHVEIVW